MAAMNDDKPVQPKINRRLGVGLAAAIARKRQEVKEEAVLSDDEEFYGDEEDDLGIKS